MKRSHMGFFCINVICPKPERLDTLLEIADIFQKMNPVEYVPTITYTPMANNSTSFV